MSYPHLLKLVALASKADESLIPSLRQVVMFIKSLGYICELEPQCLPERPFNRYPCPSFEELDKGIEKDGIDFLGRYEFEPDRIVVTLFICRIREFSAKHGFHAEDVTEIVLIHETAHFVTHLGKSKSGLSWQNFCAAESETKEEFAQEATHLLLRVAGYGHLLNVFDALSQLCPPKYDTWRQTWKQQLKSKINLDAVLKSFRRRNHDLRPRPPEKCEMVTGYDRTTEE